MRHLPDAGGFRLGSRTQSHEIFRLHPSFFQTICNRIVDLLLYWTRRSTTTGRVVVHTLRVGHYRRNGNFQSLGIQEIWIAQLNLRLNISFVRLLAPRLRGGIHRLRISLLLSYLLLPFFTGPLLLRVQFLDSREALFV